ncbi:MAG TPA: hypothetical protein VH325_09925 [Bryobacteraceae bacterium]|jgi:hypothetical protein|nr:hypothetical protein [Bryobacteraceae bacterium]
MTKSNQGIAWLLAVLLFCSGAAVGALAHRYIASNGVVNASDEMRKKYVDEMQSRLSLTPAQTNQLESILDDTKAKYKAVRDAYRPAMLEVKEQQIRRVKSILNAKQVPVYEQLLADREKRSQEQEDREKQREQQAAAARLSGSR